MKQIRTLGFLFGAFLLVLQSCQKELSMESNSNLAKFSLTDDTTKVCLSTPIVHGNYYNGVSASRDTNNYVTVVVNVKTTGSYTLKSDSANGFYFFDSGFFSKSGLNTIKLRPRGTPILVTTTEFTFSDTTCPFTLDVQDSTGTGLGGTDTSGSGTNFNDVSYVDSNQAKQGTWHFTDSISGTKDSGNFVTKGTLDNSSGVTTLTLVGPTADLTQAFGISLDLPKGDIETGVYQIRNSNNVLGLYKIVDSTIVYQSDEDVAEDGLSNSYITITSYDAITKEIQGSFHCWSKDNNGSNLTLIKGSFDAFVQ